MTNIAHHIFKDCWNIQSINIPSSVRWIEMRAFERCYALTELTLPTSVLAIGEGAFANCNNLVIRVPRTTQCAGNAFQGCKRVEYY